MKRTRRVFDHSKRLFDVAVSSVGLVVLGPVLVVTALLVHHNLGGPVIFAQERPGKDGKVFRLYKFRSMRQPDPGHGLISDEDRLTDFGKKLRATSLDELPTLWNVLKGEMSLVGPRPLRTNYLSLYSPQQARRHEVKPGVTGLAQVRGRNLLSWEEKFSHDVAYVDGRSWKLDLKIMVETVSVVVRRQGISAEGCVTMQAFAGSADGQR